MSNNKFNRIFIVGVGLIGSSIGLNVTKKRLGNHIIGVDSDRNNLAVAKKRGAIQEVRVVRSPKEILREAFNSDDLVILSTPVQEIKRFLQVLPPDPLVMDVGSTKSSITRIARMRRLRYVGSHPIAGTEKSGAAAGDIDLFQNRLCLLLASPSSSLSDVKKLGNLWKTFGSRVVHMGPEMHDRIFSIVSHLPHTLSYSLASAVGKLASKSQLAQFGFGSLKDTTRVAASSPQMWADIFLENRNEVLRSLGVFKSEMNRLEKFIRGKKKRRILNWLTSARKVRWGIEKKGI